MARIEAEMPPSRNPWEEIGRVVHDFPAWIRRHWRLLTASTAVVMAGAGGAYALLEQVISPNPDTQTGNPTPASGSFNPGPTPELEGIIIPSPTVTPTIEPPIPTPERKVLYPYDTNDLSVGFIKIEPGPSPVWIFGKTFASLRKEVGDKATSPVAPTDKKGNPVKTDIIFMRYKEGAPPNPKLGKPRAVSFAFNLSEGSDIYAVKDGRIEFIEIYKDPKTNKNIHTFLVTREPSGRGVTYNIHGDWEEDPFLSKLTLVRETPQSSRFKVIGNNNIIQGQKIAVVGSQKIPYWEQYDLRTTIGALEGEDIFSTYQSLWALPLPFPSEGKG